MQIIQKLLEGVQIVSFVQRTTRHFCLGKSFLNTQSTVHGFYSLKGEYFRHCLIQRLGFRIENKVAYEWNQSQHVVECIRTSDILKTFCQSSERLH